MVKAKKEGEGFFTLSFFEKERIRKKKKKSMLKKSYWEVKRKKMILKKIREDKKGVSPVIGVILMVAATIVIAAVVIAMLGGFGAPQAQYLVTASAQIPTGIAPAEVHVTYNGGPDDIEADYIQATIVDSKGGVSGPDLVTGTVSGTNDVAVGAIYVEATGTYTTSPTRDDHIVVTATFLDGTSQVILDTFL